MSKDLNRHLAKEDIQIISGQNMISIVYTIRE